MSEEPTKPKSSRADFWWRARQFPPVVMAIWIIIARIVVIICFVGFSIVVGAVLWVMFSGQFLVGDGHMGSLFLWSGISAVIGGFIGYGISRSIK
jgi:hypothetical protein